MTMTHIVTRLAWIAAKLVSSKRDTRYASAASWRAMTADDWKRRSVCAGPMSHYSTGAHYSATHLEVLGDLTDKPLEGQLADEEFRRLLVATDFTECNGTGAETMGLLHTTSRRLRQRVSTAQSPRVRTNSQRQSYEPQTWQRAAYAVPYLTNNCL